MYFVPPEPEEHESAPAEEEIESESAQGSVPLFPASWWRCPVCDRVNFDQAYLVEVVTDDEGPHDNIPELEVLDDLVVPVIPETVTCKCSERRDARGANVDEIAEEGFLVE